MCVRVLLIAIFFSAAVPAHPATVIDVSSRVVVPAVKRFGVNLGHHFYYDRVFLKNIAFKNAGFEGLLYQSIVRCASGDANGCVDDNRFTQWPAGFWNGAEYEFVLGAAKGRQGTVVSSAAPVAQNGTAYVFADAGVAPAPGDYFVLRKPMPGGADAGWNVSATGGASVTTELTDLPPNTEGRQAIRLSAIGTGQSAAISSGYGSSGGAVFLALNGKYQLSFRAKGAGGDNRLTVALSRPQGSTQFVNRNETLTPAWQTYTIDFSATETGEPAGGIDLRFSVAGAAALLDDVSLTQTDGDPANTTPFRDPLVATLRDLNPAIVRGVNTDLGDSFDNNIAPPFGRQRTQYSAFATFIPTLQYGLHELLEVCEFLGVEPWWNIPITFSDREIANLMEYIGGPATSPYGARRAARGHPSPWTSVFSRIHLEFGNESWNSIFRGGTIEQPAPYGQRGSDLFAIAKSSPYYKPGQFDLILGVQAVGVSNTKLTHNASMSHDTITVAPYMASRVDSFATNEELYGPLFAEGPWWSAPSGFMGQTVDAIRGSSHPVSISVYEINLHTTQGGITQEVLDQFTPSVGAAVGLANHMMHLLRDLEVREQVVFSLGGYRFTRNDGKTVPLWGITRDIGVSERKRPQFLAVKLANEALAGDLVETTSSGDDPRWNQPLTNLVQANNVPYIQPFAFVNGARRAVLVFNLHRTDALPVSFTGANAPGGAVTIKQLTGQSLTDGNESANHVAISTRTESSFNPAQAMTLPPFSMTLISTSGSSRRRAVVH